MSINTAAVISAAALVTAVTTLLGAYNRLYRRYLKLQNYEQTIREIKEEQSVLTIGVLACLKGLKEQGCNGPVTEAVRRIEEHMNELAHR